MVLSTYYYYYFISSDFETPIVGAFIAMVYGIFVLVLAGVGTAVFAIRNRKEAVKNGDEGCIHRDGTFCVPTEGLETVMKYIKEREERLR